MTGAAEARGSEGRGAGAGEHTRAVHFRKPRRIRAESYGDLCCGYERESGKRDERGEEMKWVAVHNSKDDRGECRNRFCTSGLK